LQQHCKSRWRRT